MKVNIFIRCYKNIGYVSYLASVTTLWFTKFLTKITNGHFFYHKSLRVTMTSLKIYGDPGSIFSHKFKIYLESQRENIQKLGLLVSTKEKSYNKIIYI
jgi:hypothetical protein